MKYEEMLDKAYAELPAKTLNFERFEIPKADSFIQGKKTIIKNYASIVKDSRRDEKHFLKFMTKETATSAIPEKERLILNTKINIIKINKIIESYFSQYVLCPECKKPDTKVIETKGAKMLQCEACGAISPVKGL